MKSIATLVTVGLLAASTQAFAGEYEITVTNLTRGQSFTPILVATHRPGVTLFSEGEPASAELAAMAEGGDTGPLTNVLRANPRVYNVTTIPGRLAPGASATVRVNMDDGYNRLTLGAMLIPTNDGFFAFEGVRGPSRGNMVSYESPVYDAGSEPNDEVCLHIPGPVCGGEGGSPTAGGEGYVHIHAGIHGIGDLVAADRDWRNPAAKVVIKRID